MLRGAAGRAMGCVCLVTPAVALAHVVCTGSPPPALRLVAVAAAALLMGAAVPVAGARRLAVLLVAGQLAGDAILSTGAAQPAAGCLPVMGRTAEVGLRLALLRTDPGCPPGSLAAGPLTEAAVGAAVTAAVIALMHLVLAVAGALLVAGAQASLHTLRALARLVRPMPAPTGPPPVAILRRPASGPPPAGRRRLPVLTTLSHRGPPALAA